MKKQFKIEASHAGKKIDVLLVELLGDSFSRRKIRKLLDNGAVFIGEKREKFASYKVRIGDRVSVYVDNETQQPRPEHAEQSICWEGTETASGLVAVNKPAFVPAQKTRDLKIKDVAELLQEKKAARKQWMACHRLDKETTGIMVLGDGKSKAANVMELFKQRLTRKIYLAVVHGKPTWQNKNYACFLSPKPLKSGRVEVVHAGGKLGQTRFHCFASSSDRKYSLILCQPLTGRMHQLRVQLAKLGNPIVGDKKYGRPTAMHDAPHHLLHAYYLSFPINGLKQEIIAAPPKIWEGFLASFRSPNLDSTQTTKRILTLLSSQASHSFE